MKYIHKLWSWKFRVLTILLLACAFTARYADGIIYAVLNTFGVYAIYALGQFTADEIRKAQIEVGCAECGVGNHHALYCVTCAENYLKDKNTREKQCQDKKVK